MRCREWKEAEKQTQKAISRELFLHIAWWFLSYPSDGEMTHCTSFSGHQPPPVIPDSWEAEKRRKKCSLTVSMPDRIESFCGRLTRNGYLSVSRCFLPMRMDESVTIDHSQSRLSPPPPDRSLNTHLMRNRRWHLPGGRPASVQSAHSWNETTMFW